MCVIQQTADPESTGASEILSPSLSLITFILISCLLASSLKIKYATVINNNTNTAPVKNTIDDDDDNVKSTELFSNVLKPIIIQGRPG